MPWIKFARTNDDYSFAKLKYELAHVTTTSFTTPSNHHPPTTLHPTLSRDPTASSSIFPDCSHGSAPPAASLNGLFDSTLGTPSPFVPSTLSYTGSSPVAPTNSDTLREVDIDNDLSNVENVTNTRLWLPSDIPASVQGVVASPAIVKAELDLLIAELHDCLVGIRKYRRALMITRRAYRGDEHASSAAAISARQREKISGIGEKLEVAKLRYQAAWIAADGLDSRGPWSMTYRWLEKKDIRGPTAGDDLSDLAATRLFKKLKGNISDLGQGTYEKSWIWCVALSDNTDPDDTLRVEWAKSSANAARWREELQLIPEEMGRTLAYFVWHAGWWDSQVGRRSGASHELQGALDAYARRQASLIRQRMSLFASSWLPALARAGIETSWSARYKDLVPGWAWHTRKRGDAVGCMLFPGITCPDAHVLLRGTSSKTRRPGRLHLHLLTRARHGALDTVIPRIRRYRSRTKRGRLHHRRLRGC
jgi:hypothetical protein